MSAPGVVADRRYILPPDVELIPATEDEPESFADSGLQVREVAIIRPGSRERPRVVPAEAAALLECFRHPSTVSEALMRHCRKWGGDPLSTLESAFPVLVELSRADLLVVDGTAAATAIKAHLQEGDRVGAVCVCDPLRVLRDGEIWRAHSDDGTPAAVKLVRGGPMGRATLAREAAALRHLESHAPGLAPSLLTHEPSALPSQDRYGLSGSLVLSWVDAGPVDAAAHRIAAALPMPLGARAEAPIRALMVAVAEAYARLHEAGVVHADVHPGNVMVASDGRVTLIDFGLARVAGGEFALAPRVAGGEYVDPEAAAAVAAGAPLPQVSEAAEQYSVAALLWRLLTCGPVLRLAADRAEAMRQVRDEEPATFEECGALPWPVGEAVLRRALAKNPADRYPSMHAMAQALRAATTTYPARPPIAAGHLARFEVGGRLWLCATQELGSQLAAALGELAGRTGDTEAADLARVWSLRSPVDSSG